MYALDSPTSLVGTLIIKLDQISQQFAVIVLQNDRKDFLSISLPPTFEAMNLDFMNFSLTSQLTQQFSDRSQYTSVE